MAAAPLIDLDAAQRESAYPDGIPVVYGGTTFTLPAELPIDVFDPLLDKDFDLVGMLTAVLESDADSYQDAIVDLLVSRPNLPVQFKDTIFACLTLLFGAEQWDVFYAKRPGIPTIGRLIRSLFTAYGTSLGEAFGSPASSENGGATSNPTSPTTTESTPAPSGDAPQPAQDSSAPAASAI